MKYRVLRITLPLLLVIFMVSCSAETRETLNGIATPQIGLATLYGKVISKNSNSLEGTPVRLAKVYYSEDAEAVFILEGASSPGSFLSKEGLFVLSNISPGDYVIVIGDPYTLYEIITEPNGQAKIYKVKENDILNVGEVRVENIP